MKLRAYQLDAIQQARDRLNSGRQAPLMVAPTGAGKSLIASEMIRMHLEIDSSHRVLVVAHRRELIGQLASTLMRIGLHDIGEIHPNARQHPRARIQIASTQTLRARNQMPEATLVVFDEAHHYSSDDWHELTKSYAGAVRIGFTATPMRSDGRGMSPAFDALVVVSTIKELTALGFLVPCRVWAPSKPLKRPNLASSPVDAYLAHANGRRTVVFAEFVADAEKFAAEFREKGINAVVIHGSMSDVERTAALSAHARGAVLVNCMVLTEGWDSPATSCCILARGCGSVSTYLQIVGRVLRPCEGKVDALLIDLAGRAFHTHGAPDADRTYSLTGKGIRQGDGSEVSFCPVCGQPINGLQCEVCEYTHEPGASKEEPRYTGDELAERYAGKRSEDDAKKVETLARWYAEAKARKWKPWSAISKYTHVYGCPPSKELIATAQDMAKMLACVTCSQCTRATVRTYKGGMCGKCAFSGDKV